MTRTPRRIQLSRAKGWRKPPGAIVVSRPSRWGNPYRIGAPHPVNGRPMSRAETIDLYRETVATQITKAMLMELCGHDLACWCPLVDENGVVVPCHADLLLRLANR